MDSKTKNKRDWIKNIAIIFLVILLLLTFFSRTIMNASLPEVSAQYPQYATLSSAVKASGTVKANESYNVIFEEDEQIISRKTIEESIDGGEAYRIMQDGKPVGGVVIKVDGERGDLDLLFVSPKVHSKGICYATWCEIEKLHPEVKVWETVTPYFETRNIHFYVNRCGFHIVEFFNSHHPDPNDSDEIMDDNDGMFRFEKRLK